MERKDLQKISSKMIEILGPYRSYYFSTIVFASAMGLLNLAIPISIQALVNSVTFAIVKWPIISLGAVLLILLLVSMGFNILQAVIVEKFQQHFFVTTSGHIVSAILNGDRMRLAGKNMGTLVSRYFDIMNVQKNLSSLLVGGISVALQILTGLILLSFYHPYFLVFSLLLVFLTYVVWRLKAHDAITSSCYESKAKYEMANWLTELSRIPNYDFSSTKKLDVFNKSDNLINNYLKYRKIHFSDYLVQNGLLLFIYALLSALLLGIGGYLVTIGQLSIGQLVAAELIITIVLTGYSKAGKYLENFYDLCASIEKLDEIIFVPKLESRYYQKITLTNFNIDFYNVMVKTSHYELNLNYSFLSGKKYFIQTDSYSARQIFLDLIQGRLASNQGRVTLGGVSVGDLGPQNIADNLSLFQGAKLFSGTIYENLIFGNNETSLARIEDSLEAVDLSDLRDNFKDGLYQKINQSGYPLWSGQSLRLELAKMYLINPHIIIFTEAFDELDQKRREHYLKYICSQNKNVLIIHLSHREGKDEMYDHILTLDRDGLKEIK